MPFIETMQGRLISLAAGDVQSYLVIALHSMSLLFYNFRNTTAHHWADTSLHLPLTVALPKKSFKRDHGIDL